MFPLKALLLVGLTIFSLQASGQCTIVGSGIINWNNLTPLNCQEGGTSATASVLIVPVGVQLQFNSNGDTWSGTRLEIKGTFVVNAPGQVTVNANIQVFDDGLLRIDSKLNLGGAEPCNYHLIVDNGGLVNLNGGTPERLLICNREIARGGTAGCNNNYPTGGPSYCEPSGGFTGPTVLDENGYNAVMPVTLLYFSAEPQPETVAVHWATTMEEDFSKFIIQRSIDGATFEDIGEVSGSGRNIFDLQSKYSFEDKAPHSGINYYRLKTVDLDNTFQYSNVKSVRMNVKKRITIYPNPSDGEEIFFRANFNPAESDRIQIIDRLGLQVFNAPATSNTIMLNNKLSAGVYLFKYISGNFEQVERVLIK